MSENAQKETESKKAKLTINDDDRLRYLGFDVGPTKIGELFKSKVEEQKLVDHVQEKREQHDVFRDTSNFREERISANERWTIVAACAIVILSFFLPFTPLIGGHVETLTEVKLGVPVENSADQAATAEPVSGDATESADAAGESDAAEDTEATVATEETDQAGGTDAASSGGVSGFQELAVNTTTTKVDKTPYSWSSLQLIAGLGSYSSALFSSGIVVILSALLLGLYMLMTLAIPGYIISQVLTLKGDPDTVALKLKDTMRLAWIPMLTFLALIALSMVGGSYGFDTTDVLKQFGESFSIGSLLGLLSVGFFVSLAGFLFAGSKSVEI